MSSEDFNLLFRNLANRATATGFATVLFHAASPANRKRLAQEFASELSHFKRDVMKLIIGNMSHTLKMPKERTDKPTDLVPASVTYRPLSKRWERRKIAHNVKLPNYYHFGGVQKGAKWYAKERKLLSLRDFLEEKITPNFLTPEVRASDIQIYSNDRRVTLTGGVAGIANRFSGTNIPRHYSIKLRTRGVMVGVSKATSLFQADKFVAEVLDPASNKDSGFAYAKLVKGSALGRPNLGYLAMWYYHVKLQTAAKKYFKEMRAL